MIKPKIFVMHGETVEVEHVKAQHTADGIAVRASKPRMFRRPVVHEHFFSLPGSHFEQLHAGHSTGKAGAGGLIGGALFGAAGLIAGAAIGGAKSFTFMVADGTARLVFETGKDDVEHFAVRGWLHAPSATPGGKPALPEMTAAPSATPGGMPALPEMIAGKSAAKKRPHTSRGLLGCLVLVLLVAAVAIATCDDKPPVESGACPPGAKCPP